VKSLDSIELSRSLCSLKLFAAWSEQEPHRIASQPSILTLKSLYRPSPMKSVLQFRTFRNLQALRPRASQLSQSSHIRNMSSSNQPDASNSEVSETPNSQENTISDPNKDTPQDTKSPLGLPSPSDSTPTTTIDMSTGGSTVKLDHMGPLVVNKDGTLSRISNWAEMADIERQNTLRILGKRNQLRREALQNGEGK
jgi:hypothetical protein